VHAHVDFQSILRTMFERKIVALDAHLAKSRKSRAMDIKGGFAPLKSNQLNVDRGECLYTVRIKSDHDAPPGHLNSAIKHGAASLEAHPLLIAGKIAVDDGYPSTDYAHAARFDIASESAILDGDSIILNIGLDTPQSIIKRTIADRR